MPPGSGRPRSRYVLLGVALVAVMLAALARRWLDVVEVRGASMRPTLHAGDRLLVEGRTYARRSPMPGELVLAPDPRHPSRELVKRVAAVRGGWVELAGDAPGASTDSRAFGPLPASAIRWRVVARLWPPSSLRRPRAPS